MKKFILTSAVAAMAMVSCNKESGNKGVISTGDVVADSVTTVTTNSDGAVTGTTSTTYKATDGSRAKATFDTKERVLTILANQKTFVLDDKGGGNYERDGIAARVFGDSLVIEQDNNRIELVMDK